MPWSASHFSCPLSEYDDTMKSRHASTSVTSTVAVAAASFAACAASPGRSNVLDGMHAQYEHSPPTSSRSTTATRSPPCANAPAQCSPGEPPPITMTSKSVTTRPLHGACVSPASTTAYFEAELTTTSARDTTRDVPQRHVATIRRLLGKGLTCQRGGSDEHNH